MRIDLMKFLYSKEALIIFLALIALILHGLKILADCGQLLMKLLEP